MINFDNVTKENIKEHNPNWLQLLYHLYRILMIGESGCGKTDPYINLMFINQILINFIYMLKIHMNQNIGR